jgi:hypothetical protein
VERGGRGKFTIWERRARSATPYQGSFRRDGVSTRAPRDPRDAGASAPVMALTWRGESPCQAEVSPACDRRLLRRGDTGWRAAGGELPVRNMVQKQLSKVNSIRPDEGTSLLAQGEVRSAAQASKWRGSAQGTGQWNSDRERKETVNDEKPRRHRRVVGDGMAGSVSAASRETCRGQTGVHGPKGPEEPTGRSQSVHSSEEARNERGAKGRRKVET